MKSAPGFNKISIRDTHFRRDPHGGPGVLRVLDPHALIQAAGYLKFACGQDAEFVFFVVKQSTILHFPHPYLGKGKVSKLTLFVYQV